MEIERITKLSSKTLPTLYWTLNTEKKVSSHTLVDSIIAELVERIPRSSHTGPGSAFVVTVNSISVSVELESEVKISMSCDSDRLFQATWPRKKSAHDGDVDACVRDEFVSFTALREFYSALLLSSHINIVYIAILGVL